MPLEAAVHNTSLLPRIGGLASLGATTGSQDLPSGRALPSLSSAAAIVPDPRQPPATGAASCLGVAGGGGGGGDSPALGAAGACTLQPSLAAVDAVAAAVADAQCSVAGLLEGMGLDPNLWARPEAVDQRPLGSRCSAAGSGSGLGSCQGSARPWSASAGGSRLRRWSAGVGGRASAMASEQRPGSGDGWPGGPSAAGAGVPSAPAGVGVGLGPVEGLPEGVQILREYPEAPAPEGTPQAATGGLDTPAWLELAFPYAAPLGVSRSFLLAGAWGAYH